MRQCFLALLFVVSVSPPASAQLQGIPCLSGPVNHNESHPLGTNGWLEYLVETRIVINPCSVAVGVQAYVSGISGSDSGSRSGKFVATAARSIPAPYTGPWNTHGHHWSLWPDPFTGVGYYDNGRTVSSVHITVQTSADACLEQGWDYVWDGSSCNYQPGSPLLVDTGRRGFHLTSLEDGVLFDLDGDGDREQVSWTEAGAENAWLARDLNGNGTIDSGRELFGTATAVARDPASPGGVVTTFNGFEALRAQTGLLPLTALTPAHPLFASLLLWTDRNHNGISEPDELTSAARIRTLSLVYTALGRRDRHGNTFRQRAPLTWADGHPAHVYDVWLQVQP